MREIKDILREYVEQLEDPTLVLTEKVQISEALKYHIDNKLSLTDNIFRVYSKGYFDLVNEVRSLYEEGKISLNEEDQLMVESDLGRIIEYKGETIYLDAPFIYETETEEDILEEATHRGRKVNIGKPFRTPGGPKKFAVYVKKPGGGIKKVLLVTLTLKLEIRTRRLRNRSEQDTIAKTKKTGQPLVTGLVMLDVTQNSLVYHLLIHGNMSLPFHEHTIDNKIVRTFPVDVDELELVWHQDNKDRLVQILEPGGWSYQQENELPSKLEKGQRIFIPKLVWHRVLMGEEPMVVSIEEFE